jgi:hypothetical protein
LGPVRHPFSNAKITGEFKMTSANRQNLTQSRPPTHLAPNLDKGLLGYAVAATAAGVGLLALAQPAEAKVIFTPSDIAIPYMGSIQFDINHDGIPDFELAWNCVGFCTSNGGVARHPSGFNIQSLVVGPLQAGGSVNAVMSTYGKWCAKELGKGHTIGYGKHFQPSGLPLWKFNSGSGIRDTYFCQWHGKTNIGGFLGLKFVVSGQTYYGWAHVLLTDFGPYLRGYAYEDTPGQSIVTGVTHGPDEANGATAPALPARQAASLGLLARGAMGLAVWRRPEEMN